MSLLRCEHTRNISNYVLTSGLLKYFKCTVDANLQRIVEIVKVHDIGPEGNLEQVTNGKDAVWKVPNNQVNCQERPGSATLGTGSGKLGTGRIGQRFKFFHVCYTEGIEENYSDTIVSQLELSK